MFSVVMSLVLGLTLLFGSAGAAVYASQDALPTDLLYPVKIFTEDLEMDLARTNPEKMEVLLAQIDRRQDELARLEARGEEVPHKAVVYYGRQVYETLQLAAILAEDGSTQVFEEVGSYIQKRPRDMAQGGTPADAPATRSQNGQSWPQDPEGSTTQVLAEDGNYIQKRPRDMEQGEHNKSDQASSPRNQNGMVDNLIHNATLLLELGSSDPAAFRQMVLGKTLYLFAAPAAASSSPAEAITLVVEGDGGATPGFSPQDLRISSGSSGQSGQTGSSSGSSGSSGQPGSSGQTGQTGNSSGSSGSSGQPGSSGQTGQTGNSSGSSGSSGQPGSSGSSGNSSGSSGGSGQDTGGDGSQYGPGPCAGSGCEGDSSSGSSQQGSGGEALWNEAGSGSLPLPSQGEAK
jgi:hypothetical protein